MATFVVVSPISETMSLLIRHFEEHNLRLFRHVLTATRFSFTGKFYEQIYGVDVGSQLSPVIANFFMEDFGKMALNRTAHKPLDSSLTWTTLSSSGNTDPTG
jgi:hypothetical protein